MVNYWSFKNTLIDVVGNEFIEIKTNGELTTAPFHALRFSHGYGSLSTGHYFKNNEFTIMLWVTLSSYVQHQTILDFGNGPHLDNIILQFHETTGRLRFFFTDEYGTLRWHVTTDQIPIGIRTHVAATYKHQEVKIYFDNILKLSWPLEKPITNKIRKSNLIGRNNWGNNLFDGILDELKIFDKALAALEISIEKQFS